MEEKRMQHAKAFVAGALLLSLSACSSIPGFRPVADQARQEAAQAADDAIEFTLWKLCYGYSVGSIKRAFMRTQEEADLYNALCAMNGELAPTPSREP
jgi:hypothetical protein